MSQSLGALGTLSYSWLIDVYSPNHMATTAFDPSPYTTSGMVRRTWIPCTLQGETQGTTCVRHSST